MKLSANGRLFWPAVFALLAYLFVVQVRSAISESVTADEPVELAAGYSYWKTGDYRMNTGHPPVGKLLTAFPLLWFGIRAPRDPAVWARGDQLAYERQWFEANAAKEDAILLAARLTTIFLTSCLGLAIALWTRAAFGPPAALLALALFAFDPTVTAHGHYAKNDLPLTLFVFLAAIAFVAWLRRPVFARLLLCAVALGTAIGTKLSAIFLLPVFALWFTLWYWPRRRSLSMWRGIVSLAALVGLSGLVVVLIYWIPAVVHGVHLEGINRNILHALFDRTRADAAARLWAAPIPAHPFLQGLLMFLDLNQLGHPSYLLGRISYAGWWYYFPVAFAVKTPVATLAFVALALAALLKKRSGSGSTAALFDWFVLIIPIALYFVMTILSPIGGGVRYLLPIFPFIFILIAAAFTHANWRRAGLIAIVLLSGLAAESLAIYPHYLAFFNVLSGGPAHGPAILADSNIDWGQDAKNLAIWLRQHPTPRLCVDYFGAANLAQLGISGTPIMSRLRAEGRLPRDCTAAVSVNFLVGLAPEQGPFGWLQSCQPRERVGYSIYIYDLAQCVPLAESRLADTAHPAFRSVMHQDLHGAPTALDPAVSGEILIFAMTGLGPVSPPVTPGRPAPLDVLSRTDIPLLCQWDAAHNGPMADLLFAGLAPGRTGIFQVNVLVPQSLDSGETRLSCRTAIPADGPTASMTVPIRKQ